MTTPTDLVHMLGVSAPEGSDAGHWSVDAACQYTDPDEFFPDHGNRGSAAKRVCATCPVLEQCRQWAIANDEPHGIWGGCQPRERNTLRNDIRSWAAVIEMECPTTGGVPYEVQLAYLAYLDDRAEAA